MNNQKLRAYADKMDLEYCQHGLCHYFALALASKYGFPLGIWNEFDEEIEKDVLVHAFCKITHNVYIDAEGLFRDISEKADDFPHWEAPQFFMATPEDAKTFFKRIRLPYGETETKRVIKAWLELHPLVMTLRTSDGGQRQYVYHLTAMNAGKRWHYVYDLLPNGQQGQMLHSLPDSALQMDRVLSLQFRGRAYNN